KSGDKATIKKTITPFRRTCRNAFTGTGKPEALKPSTFKGCWSRRINREHRLVYEVQRQYHSYNYCR
ncbi:UNVERIFIED_CONTAM: hypothetical protein GTU68_001637, partial [Idotea baltica]|nr:hypothetical protein [Idotea baltica]